MALTERLAILIDANGAQAVSEFKKVGDAANKQLGAAESRAAKVGLTMQKAGAGAVGFGAALTVGLSAAAQKFSDLEQATGAVESVFGSATATIAKFASTSATSIGLSEAKTKQLTATVGALLQGFGFAQDEAAKTSIQIAKLGADLSAAFGGTTEEAIQAIGAALRGERDPIERYGAAFNEAAVQAKIAALGLDTSTAAAEQHAKAQASLAIIMERTANVSGQFARESDTLAHKQQVAAAESENAAAQLGQAFAPVLEKATGLLADFAKGFSALDESTGGALSNITAWAAIIGTAGGAVSVLVGKVLALAAAHKAQAAAATEAAVAEKSVIASAALPVAVGVGIFAIGEALFDIVAGAEDADKAISKLGTSVSSADIVKTFEAIRTGPYGANAGSSRNDAFLAFKKLANESVEDALRVRNAFADLGRDTADFDRILTELGTSLPAVSDPLNMLASQWANYTPQVAQAAASTDLANGSLKRLAGTIDTLGSGLETKFAALDAQQAFDAVFQATKRVGGATRDYAADQHALEQAARSVADAEQDVIDAELALAAARQGPSAREKVDAELDRAEAALNLKEAYNAVAQAQQRLNDANKEGDPQERRDATLELEAANLRLRRAQLGNEDAQKAYNDTLNSGAEGSEKVKDAQDDLRDAQDRLKEAQFQQLQTQKQMTEQASATNTTLKDQAELAETAAGKLKDWVDKLKDTGASTQDIVDATSDARDRVDELIGKYGDLNPKLKEYRDYLSQVLATTLLTSKANTNDLTRAEIDEIMRSGIIVPNYVPPGFDSGGVVPGPRGSSQLIMAHGGETVLPTHKSGYGMGGTIVIPVVIDGRQVAQAMVDYSYEAGGIALMVRNPN